MSFTLFYDSETYSPVPIKDGTHAYAEGAEVIMHQWAVDDGPVQVGEGDMAGVVQQLVDQAERVVIHNSRFDRVVGKAAKAGVIIPVAKIWDTMAQARTVGLPGALATLCDILGVPVDKAKDKAGKQLIRLFCIPPSANLTRPRATKHTHPTEWERFLDYGKLDVVAMREVYKRLPKWNYVGFERELWELDQRINDRGFAIDLDFVRGALTAINREQARLKKRVNAMTYGEVEAATQRDAMLRHLLSEYGIELPDMQKGTLERRIEDPDLPAPVRELLLIRLEASMASVSKFKKLLASTSSDGRLRAALEFCGAARTGRWSGRLFQPQNLPRPKHSPIEIEATIDAVKAGCADLVFDDVIARCSSSLRGCIIAPPGKKLVAADLANIEGRVLDAANGKK